MILTLSSVLFWSDTCLPSLSETRANASQSWQKNKIVTNDPKCYICNQKCCLSPVIMSPIHFVRKWYGRGVSLEYFVSIPVITGHQQLKKTIKTKFRIRNYIKGTKIRNCTEISSEWRIAHCMKHWMDTWISFLAIFYTSIQDFKTNEPHSKKKFSFLFVLKSWENADTTFCIAADNVTQYWLTA